METWVSPGRPILRDPTPIEEADILVIESTYGNRRHQNLSATEDEMIAIVEKTLFERGGSVIMPAFAVGRTQEVLYHLHRLACEGRLRHPKVFVDLRWPDYAHAPASILGCSTNRPSASRGGTHGERTFRTCISPRASRIQGTEPNPLRSHHYLRQAACAMRDASVTICAITCRGASSVLIPGFQAQGTLGRRLVDGAKRVRIFGEDIPVRATVHSVGGLSAHADQGALLDWAGAFSRPPKQTFVVHGESSAALALADTLRQELGWQVTVPEHGGANWPRP